MEKTLSAGTEVVGIAKYSKYWTALAYTFNEQYVINVANKYIELTLGKNLKESAAAKVEYPRHFE